MAAPLAGVRGAALRSPQSIGAPVLPIPREMDLRRAARPECATTRPGRTPAPPTFAGLVAGTPQHYRWLGSILKSVLVLNLLDAIFTLA